MLGTVNLGRSEQQEWKTALEDYMFENPTDWIAKWLYGGMDTGMWEESMYGDILREWYGSLPTALSRMGRRRYGEKPREFIPEPAWMSELGLIAERGEPIMGPQTGWEREEGWDFMQPSRRRTPIYAGEAPGEATALRPLGAQANLTTEQLDELMYYLAYTKAGKPESRKEYLQTVAYKMPGWIQDYISESQAGWPTKAAPRAQVRPAWQR